MPDFTIPVDGADPITVTLPEGYSLAGPDLTPDGFVPAERFKAEVDRRTASAIKSRGLVSSEEAYADDKLAAVLKERGFDLDAAGKPVAKLDPDTVARLREEAAAPLREKLTAAEKALAESRRRALLGDVQATLSAELAEAAFVPAIPGTPSAVQLLIDARVRADDEGRPFFETDAGLPDYEVSKALLAYVAKSAPTLLRSKAQGGGGFGGGRADLPPSGKTLTRSQFDALNPADKAAFFQKGGSLAG